MRGVGGDLAERPAVAPAWPAQRVVARLPGSLPMGGVVAGTPIHAFDTPPAALTFATPTTLQPRRRNIDLAGRLAFAIDEVASAAEADALVAASEAFGFRDEAPGIATPPGMRMNKSVHWVADETLFGPLMARIAPLLPPLVDDMRLHPRLSHRLNVYRYDENDVFNRHIDGAWPGFGLDAGRRQMVEWPGLRSCLTMLLYLNGAEDGVVGGHTELLGADGRWVAVAPTKGSALFFRHGHTPESVVHVGARVEGPVPKYVARINVMYGPA